MSISVKAGLIHDACRRARPGFTLLAAGLVLLAAAGGSAGAQDLGAPPTVLQDPQPELRAGFGQELATGDVNGDGIADLIVGAFTSSVQQGGTSLVDAGEVFVILGPDLDSIIVLHDPAPEERALFGIGVATGDVNADGYDDVIASAAAADLNSGGGPIVGAGEAFVFFGPDLIDVIPLRDPAPEMGTGFGGRVATGDIDGDGYADVLVGARFSTVDPGTGPLAGAGEAFLFYGPGLTSVTTLHAPVPEAGAGFGVGLEASDLDHDGYADVMVGARFATVDPGTGPVAEAGEAFVYFGPDLSRVVSLRDPSPQPGSAFGGRLSSGDINGDGHADVVASESGASVVQGGTPLPIAGQAFAFLGPDFSSVIALRDPMPETEALFGDEVAVGDVNADGYADVIAGASFSDLDPGTGVLENAGEAFVFLGPDLATVLPLLSSAPQQGGLFGNVVAVDDLNGDGVLDAIVGSRLSDVNTSAGPVSDAGEVFVFPGSNDLDDDGLPDALDPDPADDDVDDDGIPDGSDPDTIAAVVVNLPQDVFANRADPRGQRNAMLSRLEGIEAQIAAGDTDGAIAELENLRRRVDSCPDASMAGETAQSDDWIADCDAQRTVRRLIDVLIGNLRS